MELSSVKICAAIPTRRTLPEVVRRMPKKKTRGLGALYPKMGREVASGWELPEHSRRPRAAGGRGGGQSIPAGGGAGGGPRPPQGCGEGRTMQNRAHPLLTVPPSPATPSFHASASSSPGLLSNLRGFSLISTMKVDGMIVQLASKDHYSSVCCYQAEVSKYEFSNSKKSSWNQAERCLGTP